MTSKFTCAGITTHSRAGVTVTKVRFGNDYVRLIKQLSSNKKIGVKEPLGGRADGYLDAVRVDLVELPSEMTKADACAHIATLPEFQSAEDQMLIQEVLGTKAPKAPRTPKTPKSPKVKAQKAKPSIDSIKSRAKRQVTAEQIVAAALAAETVAE
jgi:hypothetical protein